LLINREGESSASFCNSSSSEEGKASEESEEDPEEGIKISVSPFE